MDGLTVSWLKMQPRNLRPPTTFQVGSWWARPVCPLYSPARQVHVTLSDSPVQPHPDPIWAPPRVEVVGVPLAVIDYDRTLDWIDAMVADRRRGYVCVCNVHTVIASHEDPELRAALLSSYRSTCPTAAAGLGVECARQFAARPGLRPRADGARLRPCPIERAPRVPIRRPRP